MNTINKLMTIAITSIALFGMTGCAKTEFHPSYLKGTWTMTEFVEKSTSVTETPGNMGSASATKTETVNNITYTPTSATGTITTTNTYDAAGTGGLTSSVNKVELMGGKYIYSNTSVTSGVSNTTTNEFDLTFTRNYTITFNEDRTFSLINLTKSTGTGTTTNTGYNVENVSSNEDKKTIEGTWAFIGADKVAGEKVNERIGLWFTKNTAINTTENKSTYTDTDSADGFDYTTNNSNSKNVYTSTSTVSTTGPDVVWKMIEGTDKTMQVSFTSNETTTGEDVNTSTSGGTTSTTTTTSSSSNSSENLITLTK